MCTLRFGSAPSPGDCADSNVARSSQNNPVGSIQLDYGVTTGTGEITITDGVVVASDNERPGSNQSYNVSNNDVRNSSNFLSFLIALFLTLIDLNY